MLETEFTSFTDVKVYYKEIQLNNQLADYKD